ncbi:Transposase IS200 like protein [Halalkalibacter krulwichiae]|uniref:Transposase IS200 like protein n=1 Tax=Halalkalibacter krulwichiae TaxID=199441 RepID=A0A1X9MJA9_9BACI|nr:transposase [Halalkalibacter krulwichiae]ARK32383.1 Transposase IS200 like protein [Halalkalibacter krulwichiae]
MPRKPRTKSRSGIYHIIQRGVNQQVIFEDEEDKVRFLETLKRYKEKCQFELYGYCLMNNHVHLLLKEGEEPISMIIKRISSSYVYWYNQKYDRYGHLFQGRFKSENVEDRAYFLSVLKYIHQNPLKAGLAQSVFHSPWTSMEEYIQRANLVDIDFPLSQFAAEKKQALHLFKNYMRHLSDDDVLDVETRSRTPDHVLTDYMKELGITSSSYLQQMDKANRDDILRELKKLGGVSIRQLSRVTGVSKSVIERLD